MSVLAIRPGSRGAGQADTEQLDTFHLRNDLSSTQDLVINAEAVQLIHEHAGCRARVRSGPTNARFPQQNPKEEHR